MDHIDRKIIDLLQNNARAPLKEIADHVFLSSPRRVGPHGPAGKLRHHHRLPGTGRRPKLGYMVKAFINLDMDPSASRSFTPISRAAPMWWNATASPAITVC